MCTVCVYSVSDDRTDVCVKRVIGDHAIANRPYGILETDVESSFILLETSVTAPTDYLGPPPLKRLERSILPPESAAAFGHEIGRGGHRPAWSGFT